VDTPARATARPHPPSVRGRSRGTRQPGGRPLDGGDLRPDRQPGGAEHPEHRPIGVPGPGGAHDVRLALSVQYRDLRGSL